MKSQIVITNQYLKKLTIFAKIYQNKAKFNSIGNNFNFKVPIFYDKYKQVKLLLNTYMYDTSIRLSSQIIMNYNTNHINTFTFDQCYTNMQQFFKDSK